MKLVSMIFMLCLLAGCARQPTLLPAISGELESINAPQVIKDLLPNNRLGDD